MSDGRDLEPGGQAQCTCGACHIGGGSGAWPVTGILVTDTSTHHFDGKPCYVREDEG